MLKYHSSKKTKLYLAANLAMVLAFGLLSTSCNKKPETSATDVPATEASVETSDGAIEMLTANAWQWVSFTDPVNQFEVENPENYILIFNDDGSVNVKADCNNASGLYTTSDNSILSIEFGLMTKVACEPNSLGNEFVQNLGFTANFFFQDSFLYLDMWADGGTLKLSPTSESINN